MIDQRIPEYSVRRFAAQADLLSLHFDQGSGHLFALVLFYAEHRHALHHHASAVGPAHLPVGYYIEAIGFEIGRGIGIRPVAATEVVQLGYALRRTRRGFDGHRHPLPGLQPRNAHRCYPLHLHPVLAAAHVVPQQQTAGLDSAAHQ